jgi:transcriptional regulator with XRE-family HTH domain
MQDYRKIVGRNVRSLREQLGISQEELGFRSDLDRTYVSGVERGVRNPTVMVLARLATALDVEPSALLTYCKAD